MKLIFENVYLVRLRVVAVPYICGRDKELKRVLLHLLQVSSRTMRHLFELLDPLLLVRAEAELLFVAPQHRRPRLNRRLGQNIVEVDYLRRGGG
jgi:hypothetical protein